MVLLALVAGLSGPAGGPNTTPASYRPTFLDTTVASEWLPESAASSLA